jgi:putative ABC transport system permease protein
LKEGGKTSSGNARGLGRARRTLAISEIALAVVALSGAGLMMRSLWHLRAIDLGFRPDHVLAVRISHRSVIRARWRPSSINGSSNACARCLTS